ncbi:hypothetical protein CALVIDRAFT_568981 [Calocera viscosa TUFC12733]|uniref:Uncharacterized protein n=1 Tax=Calocera viscosa (strain TUFC12733) TaxID=1330018 RepID=A0A167GHE8_CALVF|nr:hypothetical protein CALVIDRAFT_568981 [Calocera viscosa TUFC12733]
MTEMTVPALAYVAFQVEEVFCKGGHDLFDYSRFYYDVIRLLEDPHMSWLKKAVLQWYNVRVFPNEVQRIIDPDNTADLMIQQAIAAGMHEQGGTGDLDGSW